jgi:serine-type D-Ala-D-Ala carboxypeptidase (penicillin-binding protein 5/6)
MKILDVSLLGFLLVLGSNSLAAPERIIPAPPQIAAQGHILIDAGSGKVLVEFNSEQRLPPASLTKIMTSYVAEAQLASGTLKPDTLVNVSIKAWKMEGSRMYIQEGTQVRVDDLLRGIIIQSGNDASVALAEHIAGTEDVFAEMMNQNAARIGMKDSHFMNATGLPEEDHYTTAHDLARLTVALIRDFPEGYKLNSEKYFTYNNIRQPNRNNLLWRDPTVDGVKTGHTDAAGYCLVASAERNGMRLVSVVMGAASEESRAQESQKLLTYGFRYFETAHLYKGQEALRNVRVWGGETGQSALGLGDDVVITIPRGSKDKLTATIDVDAVIEAPLNPGDVKGKLTVTLDGESVYTGDLVALSKMEEGGFFSRLWDSIALFFLQLMGGDPLTP